MTLVVNLRNPEEEKVLLAFLDSLQYDYENASTDFTITTWQEQEILRRDKAFADGKTSARTWEEIKKELENVYR